MKKGILVVSIMLALLTAAQAGVAQTKQHIREITTPKGNSVSKTVTVQTSNATNTTTVEVNKTVQSSKGGVSSSTKAVTDENGQITKSKNVYRAGSQGNTYERTSETTKSTSGISHSSEKQMPAN